MDTPTISLIVTTYNRSRLLTKTLTSIGRSVDCDFSTIEVIVVDNNSDDDTADVVEAIVPRFPFRLRYVLECNQGLSYARNRGLREARGEFVVFMDDDELIDEHYLARVESGFRETGAACLGGPIHYYNAGGIPGWLATLSENTGQFFYGNEIKIMLSGDAKKLHGGNMAFRREVLAGAGGYRVELGRCGDVLLSGEDYEIQDRLHALGQRVVYHPGMVQYHYLRPERLRKGYWRKLYFSYGRTLQRYKLAAGGNLGVRLLGAPRWMWRSLLTRDIPRLMHPYCLIDSSRRLNRELGIWTRLGQMYEARRQRAAPGKVS